MSQEIGLVIFEDYGNNIQYIKNAIARATRDTCWSVQIIGEFAAFSDEILDRALSLVREFIRDHGALVLAIIDGNLTSGTMDASDGRAIAEVMNEEEGVVTIGFAFGNKVGAQYETDKDVLLLRKTVSDILSSQH